MEQNPSPYSGVGWSPHLAYCPPSGSGTCRDLLSTLQPPGLSGAFLLQHVSRAMGLLTSQGCCNRVLHSKWLKGQNLFSHILEVGNPKINTSEEWSLLRAVRENPLQASCLLPLALLGLRCLPLICLPYVSVSVPNFPFYKDSADILT